MMTKLVRFLGSIRLAVPLLVAIAAILIWATVYESDVGSATVQTEVYKSPWFGTLMFFLAINLGISTLSRYPWRTPRKIGFALTHWGLIVIIAGSAAVIHLSTEGMMLVRTNDVPIDQIRVSGDLLEAIAPDGTRHQTDIFIRPDGSVAPQHFAGLSLLGYSDRAMKTVRFVDGGEVDNLAVKLKLHSDRMGQTLERWLAVAPVNYSQMDIGPAHLEIFSAGDRQEFDRLLGSPDRSQSTYGQLQIGDRSIDVQGSLGQSLQMENGLTVEVVNLWPDFRLDANNQPISVSEDLRNPAVQLNVTQGDNHERWFVFARSGLAPVRSGQAIELEVVYHLPEVTPTDYFRIVASPDGELFYAASSSQGFQSGKFDRDRAIAPGWADFQISLSDRLEKATVQRQIVPVTAIADSTSIGEGSPALHLATNDGGDFWLLWNEPTTLENSQGNYFVAFSPKILQLPFYVKLDDFIVERNEGSESVAMWTSQVTLFDPKTDTATHRSIWMNHPTWFRGWKLAQASWNPGDLQQSTLQIKREPWWVTALTWTGSLLVVVGITVMFYGQAMVKRFRSKTIATNESEVDLIPTADAIPESLTDLVAIGK